MMILPTSKRILSSKSICCTIHPTFKSNLSLQFAFSSHSNEKASNHRRRVDVAIVGAPNAGKSQLLNTITTTKISAVSRKRHTTRNGILATHIHKRTQLLFIDTPGFVQCHSRKDEGTLKGLVSGAVNGVDRADYTLVLIDAAKKIDEPLKKQLAILMLAAQYSRGRVEDVILDKNGQIVEVLPHLTDASNLRDRFAIVLNKVDLIKPKRQLLGIAEELKSLADRCVRYRGEGLNGIMDLNQVEKLTSEEEEMMKEQDPPIFFISGLKNDGVDDILEYLITLATPTKKNIISPDQGGTMTLIERVEEIIREKLYRCLHREVPHQVSQMNKMMQKGNTKDGKTFIRIDQDLIVRTKSHQKLVMGRGGTTLRRIQGTAQRELREALTAGGFDAVVLNLNVKMSKSRNSHNDYDAS